LFSLSKDNNSSFSGNVKTFEVMQITFNPQSKLDTTETEVRMAIAEEALPATSSYDLLH